EIVAQVAQAPAVCCLGLLVQRCDAVTTPRPRRVAAADQIENMELPTGVTQELLDVAETEHVLHQTALAPPRDRPVLAVAAEHGAGSFASRHRTRPGHIVNGARPPGFCAVDRVLVRECELASRKRLQRP